MPLAQHGEGARWLTVIGSRDIHGLLSRIDHNYRLIINLLTSLGDIKRAGCTVEQLHRQGFL